MQIKGQQRIGESKFARLNEFVRLLVSALTLSEELTKEELELLDACITYDESKTNFEKLLRNFK